MTPSKQLLAALGGMALLAPLPAQTLSQELTQGEDIVVLDPYVVLTQSDRGYTSDKSVSSTRFAIDADEVARSVTVMNDAMMRDFAIKDLDEAAAYFAGVTSGGTAGVYQIRGFTTQTPFRDGVRGTEHSDTADVARVEVLKGPASILYGQMQPGGVVNRITKKPLFETQGGIKVQGGSYDYLRGEVDLTGPISALGQGRVAYRVIVASDTTHDQQDYYQDRNTTLSTMATWMAADWLQLDWDTNYYRSRSEGGRDWLPLVARRKADNTGYYYEIPALPDSFSSQAVGEGDTDVYTHTLNARIRLPGKINWLNTFRMVDRDIESYLFDVTSTWNAPQGYRPNGAPAGPFPDNYYAQRRLRTSDMSSRNYHYQSNAAWQYLGDNWDNKLLLGVDLNRINDVSSGEDGTTYGLTDPLYGAVKTHDAEGNYLNPDFTALPYPTLESIRARIKLDTDSVRDEYAYYLVDHLRLFGEKLIINSGFRFDQVEIETTNLQVAPGNANRISYFEDDQYSPNLGVVYKITPNLMAFAAYASSFQANNGGSEGPGRFIDDGSGNRTFVFWDSLEGESLEGGLRVNLLDKALTGTVTVFDTRASNIVRNNPEYDASRPPTADNQPATQSGEEATKGVEVDLVYQVLPDLQVRLNYAYQEGSITQDPNPALQGLPRAIVPENSWTAFLLYEPQDGWLKNAKSSLAWIHQDESATFGIGGATPTTPVTAVYPPFLRPAWDRLDLNLAYRWILGGGDRSLDVSLRVENLLDEYYIREGRRLAAGRNFRLSLSYSF